MTPELAYFLKTNVAIALFYAFYRLFFYKDTFFYWRRTALLCFFAVSLLYPLLNIQEWVTAHEPMVAMADFYANIIPSEPIIVSQQETAMTQRELTMLCITVIYWAGVLLLGLRFLIQLGSIVRLHFQSPQSTIQGVRVHLLKRASGPFSFFRWIFIPPSSHTEAEISEIITHEETHARQYHSIDVLVSELMCISCWFNPFIWLMKREVRGNLEYMADHHVLETGHDCKSYQYHLLELAHHKAAANLSNSFNVLPLKNRIKMMNKQRTRKIGRTKYLMFLPLATLLLIISNIETVARTTKKFVKEAEVSEFQPKSESDSLVFQVVEVMPEFPGGVNALLEYLAKNTKYPAEAQAKSAQGRVIVKFVVKKDGSISDIKTVRSIEPSLDKEAERVIATMPKWKPGMQRGKAVNVQYSIPVAFRLSGSPQQAKAEEVKQSDLEEIVVVAYAPKEDNAINEAQPKINDNEPTFKMVETMPKFPGGTVGIMRYLAKNVKYPVKAQQNKEQGKVVVQMIVGKDGSISNVKILHSVTPALDAEAIRVVSCMPKWEPGLQRGQAVAVEYTLPIVFRLEQGK
ncbi:M56 family metallopeptidase [uncultured Bacteroides sp.]|uniref:M56 family metallopeptidase n=1 Tax=uncultured Bacteroides sp. TaxID=162156 RepID=UPI0025D52B3A|nr:M56 family metallopeptidase [uncultured Bacteroides sp.]